MAKKKNPWDRYPPEPKGDVDESAIFTSVGIALNWFEGLQMRLTSLFCALVESESLALTRAFGTFESVPQKTQMILYAAEITLMNHADLRKRTESLLTEVDQFSQRRNDIAHAHVMGYTANNVWLGFFLVPGHHVSKKTSLTRIETWDYRFTAAQIDKYTQEFRRVGNEIENLAAEIKRTLKPRSA